jgi:Ca2+-binding RTX toxin-like protein
MVGLQISERFPRRTIQTGSKVVMAIHLTCIQTNITPQDIAFLSWLGFDNTPATPTPTPPPVVAHNFQVFDQTTGQTTVEAGQPYPGPVAGITSEFIDITTHNLNIAALTPNVYIHTGDGNDGINVSSRGGNNVLDGEGGSNFLVGGSGNDTFFVNDLNAKVPSWTTMEGFHKGDAATIWGLTPKDFQLAWLDNGGAAGHTGLTLYATSASKPEIAVTIAGASVADISSHRLAVQFGTVNSMNYMEINRLT